jgi:hypothetical protein
MKIAWLGRQTSIFEAGGPEVSISCDAGELLASAAPGPVQIDEPDSRAALWVGDNAHFD